MPQSKDQNILVLGAYGLLGSGITEYLTFQNVHVTGFGRDELTARRVMPHLDWVIGDLRDFCYADDWENALKDVTAVINCSGALQDGPNDHLENIHHDMVAALAKACSKRQIKLIQISAVGATLDASTVFLSSKARGDVAIRKSGVDYTIFRPGLILAPTAYGGSALLRLLAATPIVQAVSFPEARIQSISLIDLCRAVHLALTDKTLKNFECDLVENETHSLKTVVTKMRHWLGFKPVKLSVKVPDLVARLVAKTADFLSWFGWKSPLRTTGVSVLRDEVLGDPKAWKSIGRFEISSIDQTLDNMRAKSEDRLSAKISILFPFLIAVLFIFWIVSGLMGFIGLDEAASVLENAGWAPIFARFSVMFWSVVDISLGVAILFRKFAKLACFGMVATSLFYLLASTVFVPQLWLDPLGPLVKVIPSIFLALVTSATLENR